MRSKKSTRESPRLGRGCTSGPRREDKMETLTADEMSERLGISRETFRRIWKIYPPIPVGRGKPLRSVRFLWDSDTLKEVSHVHQEIQDEEWYAISSGSVRRRAKNRVPGRILEQDEGARMGINRQEIRNYAQTLGLV